MVSNGFSVRKIKNRSCKGICSLSGYGKIFMKRRKMKISWGATFRMSFLLAHQYLNAKFRRVVRHPDQIAVLMYAVYCY